MFRYIGFQWNSANPAQVAAALHLEESIGRAAGWRSALSSPGLRVYTTGTRAGLNDVYPLLHDRGVVLGRLFRRRDGTPGARDIALASHETERILNTDGRALVDDYWGRYVAVMRSRSACTLLLRDPSGALPCFQTRVEGVAVFFSWLEDLLAFTPGSPAPRVNWEAVAALLALGHLGGRETAVQGVSQILPGQLAILDEGGPPPLSLWRAVAIARKPVDEGPQIAETRLRRTVMDCVNAWSSCYGNILLRLSGGVDSAILLGAMIAQVPAPRIICLNYHSPGSDSDERRFARLAAAKAGVELIERQRNTAFRLDDILAVSRTPIPEGYLGRMGTNRTDTEVADARHARAMFTGAFGDQLFFQFRCTWPAADYLGLRGFGRGFVRASLDSARLGRVSLWQSMRSAMVDQRHGNNPHGGIGLLFTLTRRDALPGLRHLDRYIHPDLPGACDLPIGKFHQVLHLIDPVSYYDPYLREAAPETVNPLISQPLIELCLELPTWLLTHGGRGRALARRAFARELPREIATRQSKGGMEEHATTILRNNLSLVRSLLLDGQLVRHGLLDCAKVEAALAGRLSALDGSVGEMHQHVALEAWLRQFA